MKLLELFPQLDLSGNENLKIYKILAALDGETKAKERPALLAAVSPDGKTFFPISSSQHLYKKEKHILLPMTYKFFSETGLVRDSHIILNKPLKNFPHKDVVECIGLLRGPLVREVVRRRGDVEITEIISNPPHAIWVWIKPWDYNDNIPPQTHEQATAIDVWDNAVRFSKRIPDGEARYNKGNVLVNRSTPSFSQWVRAAAEWIYDTRLTNEQKRQWQNIAVKHPYVVRRLIYTYDNHAPVGNRELDNEEVDRFALAEAEVSLTMRGVDLPPVMEKFLSKHVDPLFRLKATI